MFELEYYISKRYSYDELEKSLLLHNKYSSKYYQVYYKICDFIIKTHNKDNKDSEEDEIKERLFSISTNNDILFHSNNILFNKLDICKIYDNLIYTENLSKYYKNLFNTRDKNLCGELLYFSWASIFNNYYYNFILMIENTTIIN